MIFALKNEKMKNKHFFIQPNYKDYLNININHLI